MHVPRTLPHCALCALFPAGNLVEAYANMEKARKLDTADRYINTKCVRYAFRAGEFEEGDETVKLFLREGDGLESSMDTLQVLWYV